MTTTVTTNPRAAARIAFAEKVKAAIEAAGYRTKLSFNGYELDIFKDDLSLGELSFHGAWVHEKGHIAGEVKFYPNLTLGGRFRKAARGLYKIDPRKPGDITFNLKGLLSRLKTEIALAAKAKVARAVADARDKADDAIRLDLLGTTDEDAAPVVPGLRVSVFEGKVDLTLSELSPEMAAAVIAVLKRGWA